MKLYTLNELKEDRAIWATKSFIDVVCDRCLCAFKLKYGTLYNIIRRNANGLYCSRKCSGAVKSEITQEKYASSGGKACKRCEEFKPLSEFWPLPNPPYYRSECKTCRNNKSARKFAFYRDKAKLQNIPFSITQEYFFEVLKKSCEYCNEKSHLSIGFLNFENGYANDNCISICRVCSKLKGKINDDDFKAQCIKIYKNLENKK